MWTALLNLVSRIRYALARTRMDREAQRELDEHLDLLVDRYVRLGMNRDEARAAARRQFGSPLLVREEIYHMNSIGWLEELAGDARYGLRLLTRNRAFTVVASLTLALGIIVRGSASPAALTPIVRRVVAEADPGVAIGPLMSMRERLSLAAGAQSFWMRLLGIFAGLGAFLAAIGIYGVVSYTVQQRTQEFGIRTTLGAQQGDIMKLVLREGAAVTLIGLVLGIGGAFASTRLLQNQLFGVSRMDPVTIAVVAAVLLAIALAACFIPARRTTKLNPLLALRAE